MKTKELCIKIPEYSGEAINYKWEDGYEIEVEIIGDEFAIIANREGLLSLANHCLNLAQEGMPPNSYMRFEVGNSLMEGSFPFILERDDTLPNV